MLTMTEDEKKFEKWRLEQEQKQRLERSREPYEPFTVKQHTTETAFMLGFKFFFGFLVASLLVSVVVAIVLAVFRGACDQLVAEGVFF